MFKVTVVLVWFCNGRGKLQHHNVASGITGLIIELVADTFNGKCKENKEL